MKVKSLGYVGFGAPDPGTWLTYATEILGLMPARAYAGEDWGMPAIPGKGPTSGGSGIAPDGSVYLKMDDWQWRIAVHPNQENLGIMYLGLELGSELELADAVAELGAEGVKAVHGTQEQARARAVTGIAYTEDPMGNSIELFYGPTLDRNFQSPLGMSFRTGPLGLGHVNLLAAPLHQAQDFYTRVLGFGLSDYIRFGESDSANFFHCNDRHHSVGLLKVGELTGIHHLMLEVESCDMVCQCLERVQDAGINITSTLGRHVNDNTFSFYMSSPFGFEVEIGCDGLLLDEQWTAHEFVEGDLWGHRGLDPETITDNLAGLAEKQGAA
ncbi:MAG: VOC family protein [Halioglobus sp.]